MTDPLGPFQEFWKAWNEVDKEIRAKDFEHFPRAVQIQFEEMRRHLSARDKQGAAREVVDVISIALNTLRWLGFGPEEIAEITRDRADQRMRGQAAGILEKYQVKYGI